MAQSKKQETNQQAQATQTADAQGAQQNQAPDSGGDQGGQKAGKRKVLRVSSRPESFRRAGMQFTRRERVLYVDELTDKQVAAIKAERRLAVTEDEVEA